MAAVEEVTLNQFVSWVDGIERDIGDGDFTVPLKRCAVLIKADAKENFQGSHDPDGNPWPALKRRRIRTGDRDLPLLDEGTLQASVVGRAANHTEEVTPTRLQLGTNLEYASTHQYGAGGEGSDRPPRRPTGGRKALAIPLSKEALKKNPRKAPSIGKDLVLIRRTGKPPLLVEILEKMVGRGKKAHGEQLWKMHYVLVPEVLIPARPFLGFGEKLLEKIDRAFADWYVEKFQRPIR